MVEPSPVRLYRVLAGPWKGRVVPEDMTCICDDAFDGCDGAGVLNGSGAYSNGVCYDGEYDCRVCGGVGRVAGYPEHGAPHRLEVVEDRRKAKRVQHMPGRGSPESPSENEQNHGPVVPSRHSVPPSVPVAAPRQSVPSANGCASAAIHHVPPFPRKDT